MTDLEERDALENEKKRYSAGMFREGMDAGWLAAREYSKQREENLLRRAQRIEDREHRATVRAAARAAFDFANESDEYNDRFEMWWTYYLEDEPALAALDRPRRSMPDRMDPVLVEKAQRAYELARPAWLSQETRMQPMEAAIEVFFDELGLKEQWGIAFPGQDIPHTTCDEPFGKENPAPAGEPRVRLASDWRPVEQGDADGD